MSRVVVKNLPNGTTESKLRQLFSEHGNITDVQLKYTKEGKFRQFAFVGYETEYSSSQAIKNLNKSFVNTSRISVEICAALSDESKPKSWSKYSKDSSAFQRKNKVDESTDTAVVQENAKSNRKEKKKKSERIQEILGDHLKDPKFIEFMDVHGKGQSVWKNDLGLAEEEDGDDDDNVKDDNANEKKTEVEAENESSAVEHEDDLKAADEDISDSEYMRRLMPENAQPKQKEKKLKVKAAKLMDLLTIKVRNIPFKAKRQDIITFFKPIKPFSIRLPVKVHGICYVGFKTEADFKKAMLKNRSFWKGKQLLFTDFTEKNKQTKDKIDMDNNDISNPKWDKQREALKSEEDISESGRIFFRNLPYSTNETDLREVFEKFGPIADVHLPIDGVTRIIKGFGTVTYVLPEHAVIAFNKLDGTTFHGRLLHLIPGKSLPDEEQETDSMNFKQKKALKLKKTAGSAHNWNTLFLGGDAVANILAKNYGTTKERVLDSASGEMSAAVRLALGETEIVMQMKRFLEDNDVVLDAFDSMIGKKRSNTVILAKNLPASTEVRDLQPLFAKFGLIGRIVLPPSGVTALIEFLEPSEAKAAFRKLAYSKFKELPLYLEWAPENIFKSASSKPMSLTELESNKTTNRPKLFDKPIVPEITELIAEPDSVEDDTDPELGTTIFLRNLNFTTREAAVREHFQKLGAIHMIQVAMKKDPENPQNRISLGYGFIQFKRKTVAERALSTMQFTTIDGNKVELKRSDRTLQSQVATTKKVAKAMKQTGTKILVRNIPFQAKQQEVEEIFKTFGELKSIRLPRKMSADQETHRGFGFVDFTMKTDAKKAFDALSQSTHLYGRRLVLEWAAAEDGVEELRKRTADHFHDSSKSNKRRKGVFDASEMDVLDKQEADEEL
ncbi:probable RNA-binding protein 19 isoform X2 [Bradysia coprophila]|uniref:probable RNA-binding protein 19 isoform X2 n=1 Tax=Bradysia coprophila TaxID=38358 RepID=UPI00187D99C4|nr:probable RNA-binding protein 19 isoform X2 [Bradysia coprophila]